MLAGGRLDGDTDAQPLGDIVDLLVTLKDADTVVVGERDRVGETVRDVDAEKELLRVIVAHADAVSDARADAEMVHDTVGVSDAEALAVSTPVVLGVSDAEALAVSTTVVVCDSDAIGDEDALTM